jgi:2,4-dienoyl-CoA reductase-like NADH-dependent reductase (Old Yellow Enzyme family)
MRLFDSIALRDLVLPNRIVISPMCQYSAIEGCANDWHLVHWAQMLQSGAGLFLTEATAVSPEGRISTHCLGLWDDATADAFAATLDRVRAQAPATRMGIQLAHAGRKASSQRPWDGGKLLAPGAGGWETVAPSALPYAIGEAPPVALDLAAMARIRDDFVTAARRAADIDLDAAEIHMAHGYLLHQFLSPLANHRDDAYGGRLDHRLRYPLEVFAAVREAWPASRPLGVRVSATDWAEGGWSLDETIVLAHRLKAAGCDWIDVSTGGLTPAQHIVPGPGFQVPFAQAIREATGLTTITVGMITEPQQADAILANGDADLVALGRAILWNPRWPWHAAAELGATVVPPAQYLRAAPWTAAAVFGELRLRQR